VRLKKWLHLKRNLFQRICTDSGNHGNPGNTTNTKCTNDQK